MCCEAMGRNILNIIKALFRNEPCSCEMLGVQLDAVSARSPRMGTPD